MKRIKLTKGKFALVDDEDYEFLNQWKWHLSDTGYAHRKSHTRITTNKYLNKTIRMHRLINKTPDGFITDHINRDKLDNRKENLRTTNKSVNSINRAIQANNTSGVKGVYWDTFSKRWRAELIISYKKLRLGRFTDFNKACEARKKAEKQYHAI